MTPRAALSSFPPGTVLLGKYRIVRKLGVGGMGVVLCAEHLQLGTLVAMKLLLPELAAMPDAAPRFMREARAASRIQSEHIARVLDVGTLEGADDDAVEGASDGQPFIVMEYLEGRDLKQTLKDGVKYSIHEAIELVVQVAEALAHAHASGIVHRDVKPGNLFLTMRPDGSPFVKVLDFGISKVIEDAAQDNVELTKTTAVMGSALYMSLEQMRSTKTVDYRTDIYSLGVSLYELLTHTHPFTADSFSELCVKVSLDPPEPIRHHRPEISEELAEAIAKAYARHPDDRYPTVGTFASALAPFAAAETQATIEAITRFERASSGELPMVRVLTPLRTRVPVEAPPPPGGVGVRGLVAGLLVLGLALGGGAVWWASRTPVGDVVVAGVDAGAADAAASAAVVVAANVPVVAVPSVTVAPSASVVPQKRGPVGPPECRRGEPFYIDGRTGLRKSCP